ncbi:MAG: RNA methyltransferase PUA domain-containing protein, partial [Candidatus Omnitrophota bacterium]
MPPRFFIERLLPDDRQVRLGPNESFHARRVLRLKVGDPVEVFDGQCCRAGFIASQDSEGVSVGLTHASDGSKE